MKSEQDTIDALRRTSREEFEKVMGMEITSYFHRCAHGIANSCNRTHRREILKVQKDPSWNWDSYRSAFGKSGVLATVERTLSELFSFNTVLTDAGRRTGWDLTEYMMLLILKHLERIEHNYCIDINIRWIVATYVLVCCIFPGVLYALGLPILSYSVPMLACAVGLILPLIASVDSMTRKFISIRDTFKES